MRYAFVVLALGFLGTVPASKSLLAATVSSSFGVSVTVVSSCTALSSSPALSSPRANTISNAAPNVAIDCTVPTPHNVDIVAATESEPIAATQKVNGNAKERHVAPAFDMHRVNVESLPPGTHRETILVTISY